jgi:hypothetical protein
MVMNRTGSSSEESDDARMPVLSSAATLSESVTRCCIQRSGSQRQTIDHRWVRRTALLCQLKFKDGTDTDLLASLIGATAHEPEVSLRSVFRRQSSR